MYNTCGTQNAVLLIKSLNRYLQTINGPTVKNISEQLASKQQRHFGKSKLNSCVEKMQFSMQSKCNQARFRLWHILLSYHTNIGQGEQFLFFFCVCAVVATISPYYTPPSQHSPCPTKSLLAGQLCHNAQCTATCSAWLFLRSSFALFCVCSVFVFDNTPLAAYFCKDSQVTIVAFSNTKMNLFVTEW